ncbi:mucin-13 isoform X2 [Athene noctua]|uniref:mucin-13 isoform X2 n=1 Tax=Athene noctua TaxID=126797 RepID=UPI003EBF9D3E
MRRCVFLTVLLSLVLSLSKGQDAENSGTTVMTTPGTTENTETTRDTPVTTTPGITAENNETTRDTPVTTTPGTTENIETTSDTPVTTTPGITENIETTSDTPVTTTPGITAENNETTRDTPVTTTPGTTENIETTSDTPVTTTPGITENIETTSDTPVTTTPGITAENNETTRDTPVTTTPGTTVELCNPDPCGGQLATCVALNSTSICLCQYGFYYSNEDCHKGKIYPGVITLKGTYSNSIQNINSVQYEEMFQNITTFFENAFNDLTGFRQTVIVKIQPLKEVRASSSIDVIVANLFMENSSVNQETVYSAITKAANDSSYVSLYTATTYCAVFNCDLQTTTCKESMFPKCICKDGFSRTEWDVHSCSDCSEDCSAEENEYCAKEKGIPTCKCMTNFEKKNEECVACPVGYSGDNCNNNRELILIIVGTVFGAIILSLVIAVAVVSVRAKHKRDPEKKSLIKTEYSNPNANNDRPSTMFPRVQTTSGHANPGYQPNNPYEMRSANRGRFPERDYDDLYEISREPGGFRTQSRY